MQYLNATLLICGAVALVLTAGALGRVDPKEECLRSGGTSVEIHGQFERCIPKE